MLAIFVTHKLLSSIFTYVNSRTEDRFRLAFPGLGCGLDEALRKIEFASTMASTEASAGCGLEDSQFSNMSFQECLSSLPPELKRDILSFTLGYNVAFYPNKWSELTDLMATAQPIAEDTMKEIFEPKPPTSGDSPFLSAPLDIRNLIFDYILPNPKVTVHPRVFTRHHGKVLHWDSIDTLSLLTTNRQLNEEISHRLYQETIFRLNISPEGIKILHHPIMPLDINGYYVDIMSVGDVFKRPNAPHGFNNMRHLELALYGSESTADWKGDFLVLRSLVQYLVDVRKQAPLFSLTIYLADSTWGPSHYWLDPMTNNPRMSPFHDLSIIEAITQPLEKFRKINQVKVNYTLTSRHHTGNAVLQDWEKRFTTLLCSETPYVTPPNARLQNEQMHDALVNYRYQKRFGGKLGDGLKTDGDVSGEIKAEGDMAKAEEPESGRESANEDKPEVQYLKESLNQKHSASYDANQEKVIVPPTRDSTPMGKRQGSQRTDEDCVERVSNVVDSAVNHDIAGCTQATTSSTAATKTLAKRASVGQE